MRKKILLGVGVALILLVGSGVGVEVSRRVVNAPACGSDQLFSVSPLEPAKIISITPLGNISPPGHVIPTAHLYLNVKDGNQIQPDLATTVLAPGEMTITAIHQDFDQRGGPESTSDYRMQAVVCKGVDITLDHLNTLTPELTALFDQHKGKCQRHQVNNYQQITYCDATVKHRIAAGTVLGTAGGAAATGIDLGARDRRKPKLSFANARRHPSEELYTTCPLDLFTESVRDQLKALLGRPDQPRLIEPRCGQIDSDIPGTLQGSWFAVGSNNNNGPESWQVAASFVPDNIDPRLGIVAQGGKLGPAGRIHITPVDSGTVNRQFSQVQPGEQIICYEGQVVASQGSGGGQRVLRMLAQLVSENELTLELQSKSCHDPAVFEQSVAYER